MALSHIEIVRLEVAVNLGVGMSFRERWEVTEDMTALAVRSGGARVLSTPFLLALMECSAYELAQKGMDRGMTTVGIKVTLNHLSPTPVGLVVWAEASISRIRDNAIEFEITAYDKTGVIAEATHTRAIVNEKRFINGAANKLNG
jgi:predicted thioesterase